MNSTELETLAISIRLSEEEKKAAPRLRAELHGMDAMPWRSARIVNKQTSITDLVGGAWQTFANQTEELEYRIVHGGKKGVYADAFRTLGQPTSDPPQKNEQDTVVDYMLRLILIDRYQSLHNQNAATEKLKQALNRPSACQSSLRIDSVKGLLTQFHEGVTAQSHRSSTVRGKRHAVALPEGSQSSGSHPLEQSVSARAALSQGYLNQVTGYGTIRRVNSLAKIAENIALAALYLSSLLSGATTFDSFLSEIEDEVSKTENQNVKKLANEALGALRRVTLQPKRPLLHAAFISPLTLLVAHKLASKPRKQYLAWNMLQDGCSLGSPEVPLIRNVERQIWDLIFRVAEGKVNIQDGIHTLFQDLSMEEIDALSETEDHSLQFWEPLQPDAAETPLLNLQTSTEDDDLKRLEMVTVQQVQSSVALSTSVVEDVSTNEKSVALSEVVPVANSVSTGNEAKLAKTGDQEPQHGHGHLHAEPLASDGALPSNSASHDKGEEHPRPADQEEARSVGSDLSVEPPLPEGATSSHFVMDEQGSQLASNHCCCFMASTMGSCPPRSMHLEG